MATMTESDRQRLRSLARHQLELANSDTNLERVELWKRHNACKGERPPIHIEVGTFARQVIAPQMQCQDPFARSLEWQMLQDCINLEVFDDDMVVPPFLRLPYETHFRLFGHTIRQDIMYDENGLELGHKFHHIISDLEDDFDKILSPTEFGVDQASTFAKKEQIEDVFGKNGLK